MKVDSENDNSQFYHTVFLCFFSTYTSTANVTEKSKTLIGSSFFSSFEFSTISDNIFHSILPHKSNAFKRNFGNFDNNKFKEELNKIDWKNEIYKDGENITDVFSIFHKCLSETVDPHAAL